MRMIDKNRFRYGLTAAVLIIMFFCGCATAPRSTSSNPVAQAQKPPDNHGQAPVSATMANPAGTVVVEDDVAYELVKTPFGVIKRRKSVPPPPPSTMNSTTDQARPPETRLPDTAAPQEPIHHPPKPAATVVYPPVQRVRKPGPAAGESAITLNFDDADLYEVIRSMAEILKINYIVDPNVRGKVTIHTAGQIQRDDLFPIFFQILEANGLTAVRDGAVYKISSLKETARLPILYRQGYNQQALPPGERIVMQLVPLKNIEVAEMTKLLTPFISADGTIISHADTNTLLLVDKGINILKALKLIEGFDIDLFSAVEHRFYTVENYDVGEFANLLGQVMETYLGTMAKDVRTIPIKTMNMILVVSKRQQVFDKVEELLKRIDVPNASIQTRLYVYPVKNGNAEDLESLLNKIFSDNAQTDTSEKTTDKTEDDKDAVKKTSANPFAKEKPKTETGVKAKAAASGGETGSETLRGKIKITADVIRNALVIEAFPSDYKIVSNILERLDVLPRQVLIEALLAEITLDDSSKFGVEWSYAKGDGGSLSTSLLGATMGSAGMNYVIGQTDRWTATLEALASDNKVNILSSPTVLASNDNEATINISTEVPIANAQYQYNDASSAPVVTTNIEYRNTGIILTVTPHINENGMISMEVSEEVSEVAGDMVVGSQTYPTFFQRTVKTALTVGHNQTIVIGGLIREKSSDGESGVPGIRKIPIIGSLFGTRSGSSSKTELIILITPRVIVNLADVEAVTNGFRATVPNVSQQLAR